MKDSPERIGTPAWVQRAGGRLSPAESRSLVLPVVRLHALNAVGRLSMLAHVSAGRRARVSVDQLLPPSSTLTRAAEAEARRRLTPALLNHSHRTYLFGAALAVIEGVRVDHELLFAASLLHDVGLPSTTHDVDFTLASSRVARDVAEEVGLSSTATDKLQGAITLHTNPDVTLTDGPEAYLLAAGAGVDVAGLRSWRLPPDLLAHAVDQHPRLDAKRVFAEVFRTEARQVPRGRVDFLRRYAAFDLAVRWAPFSS